MLSAEDADTELVGRMMMGVDDRKADQRVDSAQRANNDQRVDREARAEAGRRRSRARTGTTGEPGNREPGGNEQ